MERLHHSGLATAWLNCFCQNNDNFVSAIGKKINSTYWFNQWNVPYLYIVPSALFNGSGIGLTYNTLMSPEAGAVTAYTQDPNGLLAYTLSGQGAGGEGMGTTTQWQSNPSSKLYYQTNPGSDISAMRVSTCGQDGCDIILYLGKNNALNLISGKLATPITSIYNGDAFPTPRFSSCLDGQTNKTIYVHHVRNESAMEEIQWDMTSQAWTKNDDTF